MGITRSAIWKLIQQFKALDLHVESSTGKGYRIPNGLSLLNKEAILTALPTTLRTPLFPDIEVWDVLSSTNDYLLTKMSQTNKPLCCLAERQTAGRGRYGKGKSWYSPFARNIYLSLLWHFSCDLSELSGLSLVTAIALTRVLQGFGVTENLGLKWPNDILWKQQKLAGILIEVNGETQNNSHAIIGIGINVDMPKNKEMGNPINQPWTDIFQITGQRIDRNAFVALLLSELIADLQKFQQQGFKAFMSAWQPLDLCFAKPVTLLRANDHLQGIGRGINEKGYFLLEESTGHVKAFSSGEVSLRIDSFAQ